MDFSVIRDENQLLVWCQQFMDCSKDDAYNIIRDPETRKNIVTSANRLVYQAYIEKNQRALESLHLILENVYDKEFSRVPMEEIGCERKPIITDIASILEVGMLANEGSKIDQHEITSYPTSGDDYIRWFKDILHAHKAASHEFYDDYLPNEASIDDLRYFLAQETSLDPRFDDILALVQLGTTGQEKMEIARNYWDEMGNGEPNMVHTKLFSQALSCLEIDPEYIKNNITLEARITGNLSGCLALSRRHYYKAIGYFGVTEFMAPSRFTSLVKGWARLGLPEKGIEYHKLHVKIDAIHGNAWLRNVIKPLIDSNPETGKEMIQGALIRLNSSRTYLDRLMDDCLVVSGKKKVREMGYAS